VIFGIGTDIVQVSRMEDNLARHGDRFAERILSDSELAVFSHHARPAHFLAKRFAAKEAAAKAFGTGFSDGLSLRHIVVANEDSGRPTLQFVETAQSLAQQFQITDSFLSLSDEQDYAVAFVVLEKAPA
jgi:holo-[acyl-carrier protein] synthase